VSNFTLPQVVHAIPSIPKKGKVQPYTLAMISLIIAIVAALLKMSQKIRVSSSIIIEKTGIQISLKIIPRVIGTKSEEEK